MSTTDPNTLTQDELLALLVDRFGDDPMGWAFVCPSCGDVATGQDFRDALANSPRTYRDGREVKASDLLGQECVGRTLGALSKTPPIDLRGCDWAAYGLFGGPLAITTPDGKTIRAFRPAPQAVTT